MADFFDDGEAESSTDQNALCQECQVAPATVEATFCEACASDHSESDEGASQVTPATEQEPAEPEEGAYYGSSPDDVRAANSEEEDPNEDVNDYCETCANLLADDGKCPDLTCSSNPCLQCGGSRSECECVALQGVAAMEIRIRREKDREHGVIAEAWSTKVFGEPETKSPDFTSPEEFARYLRQHREGRGRGRGRGRVEDFE